MHLLPKDIGKSDPLPAGNIFLTFWERKHHLLPTPYSSSSFPRRKEIGPSPSFLLVPAQIYFSFVLFLVENMLLENLVVTQMFPFSEIPRLDLVSRNFIAGPLTISRLCSWPQRKVY